MSCRPLLLLTHGIGPSLPSSILGTFYNTRSQEHFQILTRTGTQPHPERTHSSAPQPFDLPQSPLDLVLVSNDRCAFLDLSLSLSLSSRSLSSILHGPFMSVMYASLSDRRFNISSSYYILHDVSVLAGETVYISLRRTPVQKLTFPNLNSADISGRIPSVPDSTIPPLVPGARVGAQRVLDSYADGLENPDDDNGAGNLEEAGGDDYEGLWGGQDEPEEDDPNKAPELEGLLSADGEANVRVGAIRARSFVIRMPEPDEEGEEESGPTNTAPIIAAVPDLGPEYPEWSPAEEARLAEAVASLHPLPLSHAGLRAEFESRVDLSNFSGDQGFEMTSLDILGTEESAHAEWRALGLLLRTTAVNMDELAARFGDRIHETRAYQQELLPLSYGCLTAF
ncbi:hypothetical protein B0H13DRAFT_2418657 [Mycena leptocephala]|nr:hypothetical protein B0H13DRAFT_2418657 [Mycena leptocephala]